MGQHLRLEEADQRFGDGSQGQHGAGSREKCFSGSCKGWPAVVCGGVCFRGNASFPHYFFGGLVNLGGFFNGLKMMLDTKTGN